MVRSKPFPRRYRFPDDFPGPESVVSTTLLLGNFNERTRMANTASARKRIRQTTTRTARNHARKARMRTFVKKVELAIASGDKTAAQTALQAAQPEMQRAKGKGVIHANTVARKLSRLSARIKALSAS